MKIVEFTGVPCSGKSTAIVELSKLGNVEIFSKGWLVKSLGVQSNNELYKTIVYEFYMLITGLCSIRIVNLVKFVSSIMSFNESLFFKFNILRNVIHKYSIHRHLSNIEEDKTIVVDEGISHIPYLFLGHVEQLKKIDFMVFHQDSKPYVVKLKIKESDAIKRLKSRGHKRVKLDSEIQEFAKKCYQCSDYQDSILRKYSRLIRLDSISDL